METFLLVPAWGHGGRLPNYFINILYSYFHEYKINIFHLSIFLKPEMYKICTSHARFQSAIDSYFALKTIIKLMPFLKVRVIFDSKRYHKMYFSFKKH